MSCRHAPWAPLALAALSLLPGPAGAAGRAIRLDLPPIAQRPERCGPASLAMVMRYLGAPDSALAGADRAYSPALKGALITDLAAAARRAGFEARVAALTEDSLRALLSDSVACVLHFQRGAGPVTRGHYGVLVGWDAAREEYLVNDGGARTARYRDADLMRRWKAAGSLALIVARPAP